MSLLVWLPLNGDLLNKGIGEFSTSTTSVTYSTNGKIGSKCLTSQISSISVPNMIGKKQMSFAYWVKIITATSTNWLDSFRWYSTDGTNDQSSRQEFYTNSTLTGIWFKADSSGVNSISGKTNVVGEWRHYAATLDYLTGDVKFYINGSLVGSTKSLDTSHYIKGTNFLLHENNLDHAINDFRLYDHVLSLKEIKEISKGLVLHYPLDNNGLGKVNPNLLRYPVSNSKWTLWGYGDALREKVILLDEKTWVHVKQLDTTRYDGYSIAPDNNQIIIDNTKKYTISCLAKAGNKTNTLLIIWWHWRSTEGGANIAQDIKRIILTSTPTKISYTLPQYTNQTYNVNRINIMMGSYKANNEIYFTDVKFELGTLTTPWIPHIEDPEYSALGYNDTTVYDCSGYLNNATANNITYSTNTPRYEVSSLFITANTSYIKINENNWMAQHTKEMTINFWAYAEDWTTQTNAHLFSCTESGGFNTLAGSSGYLRFPIYVCTNEALTSYAYKYDSQELKLADLTPGWHMFTYIYLASSGTKVYIDAKLHHTYNNVSYGIRFNTNARLFLGCLAASANSSSPYFNGKESDFRLYYTVLSDLDISLLYYVSALADRNSNFYISGSYIENDLIKITHSGNSFSLLINENLENKIYYLRDKSLHGNNFILK